MKSIAYSFKMLALALALMVVAATAKAAPVTYFADAVTPHSATESVALSLGTATGPCVVWPRNDNSSTTTPGFVWSGYTLGTAGTAAGLIPQIQYPTNAIIMFNEAAMATGAYAYTCFDTRAGASSTTDPTAYNQPAITFNGSASGSEIVFNETNCNFAQASTMGVMIYDGTAWWESDAAAPHPLGNEFRPDIFPLSGTGVVWNKVTSTILNCQAGSYMSSDADLGVTTTTDLPNTANIQGVGLWIKGIVPVGGANHNLSIDGVSLVGITPTAVSGVNENYHISAANTLNQVGGAESIHTMNAAGGTGFAWGGYVPNSSTVAGLTYTDFQNMVNTPTSFGSISPIYSNIIRRPCVVAGARSYTRFDTITANNTANAAFYQYGALVPAYSVNLGGSNAGLHVKAHFEQWNSTGPRTMTGVRIAALIRSSDGHWYQSNDQPFTPDELAEGPQNLYWPTNATTWTTVLNTANSGGADMDWVNGGGQTDLTYGGVATPDLSAVQGMGYVLTHSSNDLTPGATLTNYNGGLVFDNCALQADAVPPAVPTTLHVTAQSGSENDLSWSAVTDADLAGYNVYRGTTATGPFAKINTTLVTGATYPDTGLTAGPTYYYFVTSVDNATPLANESNWSNIAAPGVSEVKNWNWMK